MIQPTGLLVPYMDLDEMMYYIELQSKFELTKLLGKQDYKEGAYAPEPDYGTTAVREAKSPSQSQSQ